MNERSLVSKSNDIYIYRQGDSEKEKIGKEKQEAKQIHVSRMNRVLIEIQSIAIAQLSSHSFVIHSMAQLH